MAEFAVTFLAGASYGLTTVVVGQPLDTVKTRMQGLPAESSATSLTVARDLFAREGVRGLYRGGLPVLLGGSLMRSAQFGVSAEAKEFMRRAGFPSYSVLGIDYQVVLAGVAGGIGRGLVEIPADFVKVRRQVEGTWTVRQLLGGTAVTLARNSALFAAFVVYMDLAKQACAGGYVPGFLTTPDGTNLSPFAKGAICANLAWLTVWPADVVKTQRQSGNYSAESSSLRLLVDNLRSGRLYRGVVPGLVRSSIANGSSMVVYEWVQSAASARFGLHRKDLA